MCSSGGLEVRPKTSFSHASHNSTVWNNDLKRAVLTHIDVSITSTFLLVFCMLILFIIVYVVHKLHRTHILDLHKKVNTMTAAGSAASNALRQSSA